MSRITASARTGAVSRTTASLRTTANPRGLLRSSSLSSAIDNTGTPLWFTFGNPPVVTVYASDGVHITPGTNATGYGGVVFTNYNPALYATRMTIKVNQVCNIATNTETQIVFGPDGNESDKLVMGTTNGSLVCRARTDDSNSDTFTTWDAVAMKWWRIEAVGGYIFYSTSPDDVTYTVRRTAIWVSGDLGVGTITIQAGTYDNESAPGTAIFSNFRLEYPAP